jgi:hypothetical protein
MTQLQTIERTLPAIWASYLINGDASNLETEEQRQADKYLKAEGLRSPVGIDSEAEGFRHTNDASWMGGSASLAQECAVYSFLMEV